MLSLLARRLLAAIPVLFVVSGLTFSIVHLVPGDPAASIAGEGATIEQIEEIRQLYDLDEPLVVQYGIWLSAAVQGDLGRSLFTNQEVTDALADRVPVTLTLTGAAMLWALVAGLPVGLLAAARRRTTTDRMAMVGMSAALAMPSFWLAGLFVIVFVVEFGWFPAIGYEPLLSNPLGWLKHITLPAIALGAAAAAEIARQVRGSMIDVLDQDYVRTARAKGLRAPAVFGKHALKNALIPVVTVLGLQVAHLFGGSVIIEHMFGLPGLGSLAIEAVFKRDLPLIQGIVLMTTLIVVVVNLVVDVTYGLLDPKVRDA